MEKHSLYLEKIEANLTQYNARLSEMRGKAAEIQVDMKLEYLSQLESLEKKRDELQEKHEQLKKAGEHAWKDVKAGTEKAWRDLKDSVDKATKRF
jgi:DNA repair exonuclease SbcCD ATPase subunit